MKIKNLEKKIDVSNLKFDDFNPWPFIRNKLMQKERFNNSLGNFNFKEEISDKSFSSKIKSYISKVIKFYQSFLWYIKNPIQKQKIDILYLIKFTEMKINYNNQLFNEYTEPLIHFAGEELNVKILEINCYNFLKKQKKEEPNIIHLDFIKDLSEIKAKLKIILGIGKKSTNIDLLKNEIDINELEKELIILNEFSKNIEKLLKKLNPKVVYLVCFYDTISMAMTLACHRLKIKVVEYQHGFLNDFNSMYTNWHNVPSYGYELIPDIFWMWSKENKEKIDQWSNKTSKHKAIVGGNMWIAYNKKINIYKKFKNKNGKKNILVILQFSPLPKFFINFLEKKKQNFNWYFRSHPLHPIPKSLKDFLENYSYENIELTSKRNLFETFNFIDINITLYSSVGFEGQCFHVPSIFIGENAKHGFKKLLGKNGLFYAENENDLDYYLRNLENISKIDDSHILFNESKITKHIKKLMC